MCRELLSIDARISCSMLKPCTFFFMWFLTLCCTSCTAKAFLMLVRRKKALKLRSKANYWATKLSTTLTQAFAQFIGRYPPPPSATILPPHKS